MSQEGARRGTSGGMCAGVAGAVPASTARVLSGQPCPYSSRQRDESRNWPAPRIKVGEIG